MDKLKKIGNQLLEAFLRISHGLLLFFFFAGCTLKSNVTQKDVELYSESYTIVFESENKLESINEDYFYIDILNRVSDKSIISNDKANGKGLQVKLVLLSGHLFDYEIKVEKNKIQLIANNEKNLKWLFNQFLKKLSLQDDRIATQDLPPAIVTIQTAAVKFPFEYREAHFYPNLQPNSEVKYNSNNVENDWGIWGHNLGKLLLDNGDSDTFAIVENKKTNAQLCFSSDATYKFLENYIIDNFGIDSKTTYSFMIVPNDNKLVCQDEKCKSLGNAVSNASPSVFYLLEKLAAKFPNYNFFTTAYLSVQGLPLKKMPKNVGIMISTIDFPKNVNFQSKPKKLFFENRLKEWKQKINKVYLWDYVSNFDDYLTVYPFFYRLQKQLIYFDSIGVEGVFLNGSGYDYTSFQELKTFVSSALLLNPKVNVEEVVRDFFKQEFPQNCKMLSDYYLSIENESRRNNFSTGLYDDALNNVNSSKFFQFYLQLQEVIKNTLTKEKSKLEELLTGLSFTYLKLAMRQTNEKNGFFNIDAQGKLQIKNEVIKVYENLKKHSNYSSFKNYKEENGSIVAFLNEFEKKVLSRNDSNKLFGKKIKALSKLDEDYQDVSVLTDNSIGFLCDYHIGWLLSTQEDLVLELPNIHLKTEMLKINFLHNPHLSIYKPVRVEVYKNDALFKNLKEQNAISPDEKAVATFTTELSIKKNEKIVLKIIKDEKNKKIACDEIQLF